MRTISSDFNSKCGVKRSFQTLVVPYENIECHSPDDKLNIYDPEDMKTYIISQAFTELYFKDSSLLEMEANVPPKSW
jgi:hypothetical protein